MGNLSYYIAFTNAILDTMSNIGKMSIVKETMLVWDSRWYITTAMGLLDGLLFQRETIKG